MVIVGLLMPGTLKLGVMVLRMLVLGMLVLRMITKPLYSVLRLVVTGSFVPPFPTILLVVILPTTMLLITMLLIMIIVAIGEPVWANVNIVSPAILVLILAFLFARPFMLVRSTFLLAVGIVIRNVGRDLRVRLRFSVVLDGFASGKGVGVGEFMHGLDMGSVAAGIPLKLDQVGLVLGAVPILEASATKWDGVSFMRYMYRLLEKAG